MCAWRCLGQCLGCGPGMAGWEHCLYKSRLGFSWALKSNLVQDFSEVYSSFGIRCLVLACFFSFLVCLTNQEVVVKGLQTCLGVPATFAVLQAWQTAFFLLAGSRQDLKKVLPHTFPEFFTVPLSLGCMRRNIKYLRTFQKLKGPPAKMEMTVETPFPWMKSLCQCSQRNQMLAVRRGSQCQFPLIQDKSTL